MTNNGTTRQISRLIILKIARNLSASSLYYNSNKINKTMRVRKSPEKKQKERKNSNRLNSVVEQIVWTWRMKATQPSPTTTPTMTRAKTKMTTTTTTTMTTMTTTTTTVLYNIELAVS